MIYQKKSIDVGWVARVRAYNCFLFNSNREMACFQMNKNVYIF